MSVFNLPDLGEGLPDAEISQWHVKEGETIQEDQPLVAMETAKAVVDVPSPFSGKIVKLCGDKGDIIKTGAALVVYEDDESPKEDAGTVVGNIASSDEILQSKTQVTAKRATSSSSIKATPAVRAHARKLGVDLNSITPSGPDGVITMADLSTHSTNEQTEDMAAIKGSRRTMARVMAKSHQEVVPVTLNDDAYLQKTPVDLTLLIIRAIVQGLKVEPALNVWFDGDNLAKKTHDVINLGIAVDSQAGLVVPVIHDIEPKTSEDIRQHINDFKKSVSDKSISPDALKDPTFVLSNFGMFSGTYGNPIVVPPTVGILGIGKLQDAAYPQNQEIAIFKRIPLSLTFDHRAVTGGEAARFLAVVIRTLQSG